MEIRFLGGLSDDLVELNRGVHVADGPKELGGVVIIVDAHFPDESTNGRWPKQERFGRDTKIIVLNTAVPPILPNSWASFLFSFTFFNKHYSDTLFIRKHH